MWRTLIQDRPQVDDLGKRLKPVTHHAACRIGTKKRDEWLINWTVTWPQIRWWNFRVKLQASSFKLKPIIEYWILLSSPSSFSLICWWHIWLARALHFTKLSRASPSRPHNHNLNLMSFLYQWSLGPHISRQLRKRFKIMSVRFYIEVKRGTYVPVWALSGMQQTELPGPRGKIYIN